MEGVEYLEEIARLSKTYDIHIRIYEDILADCINIRVLSRQYNQTFGANYTIRKDELDKLTARDSFFILNRLVKKLATIIDEYAAKEGRYD